VDENAVDSVVFEDLITLLPELGLLTEKNEAHARAVTARCLTQDWVNAVMQGERPPAPRPALLAELDPSLTHLVTQIHQAVFYLDPFTGN